ncbi:MAG: hypothetical protein LBE34_06700 [Flavobacteriaceae bacterium]|jgi:hypothetical protein|nr:hypothetical protein [Flavobacteriaceae bacterium]
MSINIYSSDILAYVRIEPRVVSRTLAPTIKAAVYDALWMLTQQSRVGEFQGEDSATLIKARVQTQSVKINRFKSRKGKVEEYDERVPLEAKIERLPLIEDLGLSIELSNIWTKLVTKIYGIDSKVILEAFLLKFPIDPIVDNVAKSSNKTALQVRNLVSKRSIDGVKLLDYFKKGGKAVDIINGYPELENKVALFLNWVNNTYYTPNSIEENSWSEKELEYSCTVSAPITKFENSEQNVLVADKYKRGDLDWYSFDLDDKDNSKLIESGFAIDNSKAVLKEETFSYIPSNIEFKGMPKGKWWEFEDKNIDLAKMLTQKSDVSKMIIMEFGLIYSNDWFIIPHVVTDNSITEVKGLVVSDVFGRNFVINRAGTNVEQNWHRWDMYNISRRNTNRISSFGKLLSIPRIKNRMESAPHEKVMFLRDEMANMIWGVEEVVPNEIFGGMDGKNAYLEIMDYLETNLPKDNLPPNYVANDALHRFKLSNSVPENWIPFIATKQLPNLNGGRDVMVQRASMLRYIDDKYTNEVVRPRTDILSIGIKDNKPYFINEEIVGRSGFIVSSSYQRARWYDGSVFTWVGRSVKGGRGEGNSGLKFDMLADKESDF